MIIFVLKQAFRFVLRGTVAGLLAGCLTLIQEGLVGAAQILESLFLVDTTVLAERTDSLGKLTADTVHCMVSLSFPYRFPFSRNRSHCSRDVRTI
jgi:hypothetical protein